MCGATNRERTCQVDACAEHVPPTLLPQRICVSHYLEEAFTRAAAALRLCQLGQPLDLRTADWLVAQGDLTVQLLSKQSHFHSPGQRARLLELLLCLTNIQEHIRRPAMSKIS